MFNRTEYGLQHPGNIIPVCKKCNERDKDAERKYVSWEQQLAAKNDGNESASYKAKHQKIIAHINRYNYPELSDQERHAIRVIAEALYENIKTESDKSLKMYRSLDEAFVQNKQNTKD